MHVLTLHEQIKRDKSMVYYCMGITPSVLAAIRSESANKVLDASVVKVVYDSVNSVHS